MPSNDTGYSFEIASKSRIYAGVGGVGDGLAKGGGGKHVNFLGWRGIAGGEKGGE